MSRLGEYGSSIIMENANMYIEDADGDSVFLTDGEPTELRDALIEKYGYPEDIPEGNETLASYDSEEPVTELPGGDDGSPVQTMSDVEERLQALETQLKELRRERYLTVHGYDA